MKFDGKNESVFKNSYNQSLEKKIIIGGENEEKFDYILKIKNDDSFSNNSIHLSIKNNNEIKDFKDTAVTNKNISLTTTPQKQKSTMNSFGDITNFASNNNGKKNIEKIFDNSNLPQIEKSDVKNKIMPLTNLSNVKKAFFIEYCEENFSMSEEDKPKFSSNEFFQQKHQEINLNGCNCRNTQCLQKYCECFKRGEFCVNCNCLNCENKPESILRKKKIKTIEKKTKNPFQTIGIDDLNKDVTSNGCNCKKSFCLKKYCECFQFGNKCSPNCKCINCKNICNENKNEKRKSEDKENKNN